MSPDPPNQPEAHPPPGERTPRSAFVVINSASGPAADRQAVADRIAQTFADHGWQALLEICDPPDLQARMAAACQSAKTTPGAIVVVGGGDGTIRSAAALAVEHGVALGILPMGTMNLLPKDLGLPLDPVEAAQAIATGIERRIDVGRVNDRIFLHSSVLGVVPLLGREREEFRRSRTWGARLAALRRALRCALGTPRITLQIEEGGRAVRVRTYSLAICSNTLSDKPGEALLRTTLDGGRLALYLSRHRGRLGLFTLLLTLGTGRWTLDRQMQAAETTTLRITARRRRLAVSNDGEVEHLATPLRYSLMQRALRVVVAANLDGA